MIKKSLNVIMTSIKPPDFIYTQYPTPWILHRYFLIILFFDLEANEQFLSFWYEIIFLMCMVHVYTLVLGHL